MKTKHYGKNDTGDGTWFARLYPLEQQTVFAKWGIQQFKDTHVGWEPMGNEIKYATRKAALSHLARLGYFPVD